MKRFEYIQVMKPVDKETYDIALSRNWEIDKSYPFKDIVQFKRELPEETKDN